MLGSLSSARRRFVLGVVALVLALTVLASTAWIRAVNTSVDPVAQEALGPVLLVPGYGGSTTALEPLVTELRAEGRTAVVVTPPGSAEGDLRAQARNLAKVADRARAGSGAKSVDVIGYSAGGVVARLWVRDYDGGSIVRRVITLGSPHHGTQVASLAVDIAPDSCPVACQQLAVDSDLLRELNAGDETPEGPLYVSIWSTTDEVVTPPDSARLSGALNLPVQDVCAGTRVSHGALPTNMVVLGALPQLLGSDLPKAPSRSACAGFSS